MDEFNLKLKYMGYSGINLEKVSINSFRNIIGIISVIKNNPRYDDLNKLLRELPNLSFEQISDLSKKFCEKYFSLSKIMKINSNDIKSICSSISNLSDPEEVYGVINSHLTEINPLDIDVKLVDGHAMSGRIVKPLLIHPKALNFPSRKVYFSHIEIGKEINMLSSCTLVHEIAHAEQEKNFGYTRDYLNREIISIFLEKVSALEMDPTGELLRVSESVRFGDLLNRYMNLYRNKGELNTPESIEDMIYVKSILYATKLFDMYLNERKQKNKDKYFYEIQDVFDGKITVEDIIRNREITPAKVQDLALLKRHI